MTVRLTSRDAALLSKCVLCRSLTTAQIGRLFFPNATANAVQKRLRKLTEAGYLRSMREHRMADALHAIGPKAKPVIEGRGLEPCSTSDFPRQAEHLVGVNDLRIAVEMSPAEVGYFFAYWQLGSAGWMHPVIPDAVFAFGRSKRRSFLAEYDRGTEPTRTLGAKLKAYADGLPGFAYEAVVIVIEGARRLEAVAAALRRYSPSLRVLLVTAEDVAAKPLTQCALVEVETGKTGGLLDVSNESEASS
jgi:hypothetical protein